MDTKLAINQLSPSTRYRYRRWCERFREFTGKKLSTCTQTDADNFILSLIGTGCTIATVNQARRAISLCLQNVGINVILPTKSTGHNYRLITWHSRPKVLMLLEKLTWPEKAIASLVYYLCQPPGAVLALTADTVTGSIVTINGRRLCTPSGCSDYLMSLASFRAASGQLNLFDLSLRVLDKRFKEAGGGITPKSLQASGIVHILQQTSNPAEIEALNGMKPATLRRYLQTATGAGRVVSPLDIDFPAAPPDTVPPAPGSLSKSPPPPY